jgi:hypothetical protein
MTGYGAARKQWHNCPWLSTAWTWTMYPGLPPWPPTCPLRAITLD